MSNSKKKQTPETNQETPETPDFQKQIDDLKQVVKSQVTDLLKLIGSSDDGINQIQEKIDGYAKQMSELKELIDVINEEVNNLKPKETKEEPKETKSEKPTKEKEGLFTKFADWLPFKV